MQGCNAVDRVAADDGEVGHADAFLATFFDDGEEGFFGIVAGPLFFDLDHEARVDFVNELEVAWEDFVEETDAPFLQRFGKEGMIGVGEGLRGDLPSLIP